MRAAATRVTTAREAEKKGASAPEKGEKQLPRPVDSISRDLRNSEPNMRGGACGRFGCARPGFRAPLRRISSGVRRAGAGQTRLAEQTAPDAGSGAPRRSAGADEMQRRNASAKTFGTALIQTSFSCTPQSKVFTVSEDSVSESNLTPHE